MSETSRIPPGPGDKDFPYFRRLWKNIVVALLGAAFIPLVVIGGGMYYYAGTALKQETIDALHTQVEFHRQAVDRFLQERTQDLEQLAKITDLASLTRPGAINTMLASIQSGGNYFTDLGIIDGRGRHLAYAGPYDLMSKNYRQAQWFNAAMAQDVYISDVFAGFRKVPHFIIAVKHADDNGVWIIRATIDAGYFDHLVAAVTSNGSEDAFLVNRSGLFQTGPPVAGRLMGPSEIKDLPRFDGIQMQEQNGRLRVMVWLESVPWLCVVQMERSQIFHLLKKVRLLGIFAFILGGILIAFTVLLTANHLVGRLETKRRSILTMDQHLRQANKMTLSLQLFPGFLQEISEALVNIGTAATVIEEQAARKPQQIDDRHEIGQRLAQIKSEITRGRKTIHQLIDFSLAADPMIDDIDVNRMLDELTDLLRRELRFHNIVIVRDYLDSLPPVRNDPALLRQVLQNLMFNALSAVDRDGEITLKTEKLNEVIRVTVSDSGPGIAAENLEKIFEPLFTTDPKRLGLGLAICKSILAKLGGRISVEGHAGKGASFVVDLPFQFQLGKDITRH